MRRAIVTGATGFVGLHLINELLAHGYEVLAVVRSVEKASKLFGENTSNLSFVSSILPDYSTLSKTACGQYDFFFHMAWEGVSGRLNSDMETQQKNVLGAIYALQAAKRANCRRFIGAGSLHEIECKVEMELPHAVLNYNNYYKTAKLAAHYYCKLEAAKQKIDFLWPRLTNTYGVGELSERLINSTIRKLLRGERPAFSKGDQLYNFIYITDVARAYRLLAERGTAFTQYMISSDDVRPLKSYLLEVGGAVNPKIDMGFGEHPYSGVYLGEDDLYTEALMLDTGFRTQVPFAEGIKETMEFIMNSGT